MPPIAVLVVDDHPALRAGLGGLLAEEPGFSWAGAVADERGLAAAIARARPDVVVLDYALGRGDGLSACFRLKQRPDPPGVVVYSAYADGVLAVPAAIAQADAVVAKSAPVTHLLAAIRDVAAGEAVVPAPDPEALHAASSRLRDEDLPVLGMLFARVPVRDIAETLGTTEDDVRSRVLRVIGELQAADRRWPPVAGTVAS